MKIVYFTSGTGNTRRFVNKIGLNSTEITADLILDEPFILFCPTYSNGEGKGAVPKPIINLLNNENNRKHLKAVIGFGNSNFGKMFCIGSEIVAHKCNVPLAYRVELFGNADDVENVKKIIEEYDDTTS